MERARQRTLFVAVAVIERSRSREFLICRRSPGRHYGGCWEFPGGKRKRGESWHACLRREIREELGVRVRVLDELDRFRYRYPEHRVSFRVFRCAIARGTPRPLDAQAMRWVPARHLRRYRFPPANHRLIERLRDGLSPLHRRGIIREEEGGPQWSH